jgi:hypothetical protein
MEISRIDETRSTLMSEEISLKKGCRKACIYYPEVTCATPNLQFMICRTCPRAAQYISKNMARSIFDHIKACAISLIQSMNIQLSK